jgi:hypothetical protein
MKVYIATVFKTYSGFPITYYSKSLDTLTSYIKALYPKLDLNDTEDTIFGFKDIENVNDYIYVDDL